MANGAFDEKRQFTRVVSVNLVTYKHFDDAGEIDETSMGRTRNISEGGILLEVFKHYPLFSIIELQIAIGEKIITPRGRVVRLQELEGGKVEMGIKFVELAPEDRDAIVAYVATHDPV
jgi:c-di-GMP-binding flagellar brake protein YcgR